MLKANQIARMMKISGLIFIKCVKSFITSAHSYPDVFVFEPGMFTILCFGSFLSRYFPSDEARIRIVMSDIENFHLYSFKQVNVNIATQIGAIICGMKNKSENALIVV